ncbi:hypothetical protein ACFGVR_16540 [Mucilaginibacter sp. AW1-3]
MTKYAFTLFKLRFSEKQHKNTDKYPPCGESVQWLLVIGPFAICIAALDSMRLPRHRCFQRALPRNDKAEKIRNRKSEIRNPKSKTPIFAIHEAPGLPQ